MIVLSGMVISETNTAKSSAGFCVRNGVGVDVCVGRAAVGDNVGVTVGMGVAVETAIVLIIASGGRVGMCGDNSVFLDTTVCAAAVKISSGTLSRFAGVEVSVTEHAASVVIGKTITINPAQIRIIVHAYKALLL